MIHRGVPLEENKTPGPNSLVYSYVLIKTGLQPVVHQDILLKEMNWPIGSEVRGGEERNEGITSPNSLFAKGGVRFF
jgi:hypothetical protein